MDCTTFIPTCLVEKSVNAESNYPRFDARVNDDPNPDYINPFTGKIGNKSIGTHVNLETLKQMFEYESNASFIPPTFRK